MTTYAVDIQQKQARLRDLTERGIYLGKGGAIALSKHLFRLRRSLNDGENPLCGLASTYYSAAAYYWATAGKKLAPIARLRTMYYALRAYSLSDELERQVGVKKMTAGELDVRQTILRRFKEHTRAMDRIREGLSRDNISANTRVLLLIGQAEILYHRHNSDTARAEQVYAEAARYVEDHSVPPMTQARYYRSFANFMDFRGLKGADFYRQSAIEIAEAHQLDDQVVKATAA